MNEVERQILKNQSRLLSMLSENDRDNMNETIARINETQILLDTKKEEGYGFTMPFGCAKNPSMSGQLCGEGTYLCKKCKDFSNNKNEEFAISKDSEETSK